MSTTNDQPAEAGSAAQPAEAGTAITLSGEGVLTIRPDQERFTPQQIAALEAIGITRDFSAPHVRAFIHLCGAAGLDPWRREAYLIRRKSNAEGNVGGYTYTTQLGIDGLRSLAERTGHYRGQEGPLWAGKDGVWRDHWADDEPPVAAKVGVRRAGWDEPVWGVAAYREYVPLVDEWTGTGQNRKRTGKKVPGGLWKAMPAGQLAKCAEALALRKAFPRSAGGWYVHEEMDAAEAAAAREATREAQRRLAAAHQAAAGPAVQPAEEAAPGRPAEEVDALLTAELGWQAEVLGRPVDDLTERARAGLPEGGRLGGQALRGLVLSLRPAVAAALRTAGLDWQAEAYEAAGDLIAEVETLTGQDQTVEAEVEG